MLGVFFIIGNPGLYHDYEPGQGGETGMSCLTGAALYGVTLIWSIYSIYMNKREQKHALLTVPSFED